MHPFVVWTDHKNLLYLHLTKHLNFRQARWALFLQLFNYTLTYCPGPRDVKPDALSHQSAPETPPSDTKTILPPSCLVGATTWESESIVQDAQHSQPNPDKGPPNCLFVPDSARSQVFQWGHSSCHPTGLYT